MHVMNEDLQRATVPTPEQLFGRQIRLLRQGRGWSQQDVAVRMKPFGYSWSQATVTRLEAATRPIRLNEVFDLAMLFEVPPGQFLESSGQDFEWDDLEALEREIEKLTADRAKLEDYHRSAAAAADDAARHMAAISADLARINGRLDVLARWHPAAREARKSGRGGTRR